MDIYADEYRDGLDCIDKGGNVSVPNGPGMGVKYDWDFIKKHQISFESFK